MSHPGPPMGGRGFYDLSEFYVVLARHSDPSTVVVSCHHELMHHFLACTTVYGHILKELAATVHLDNAPAADLQLLQLLRDGCFRTQEMLATYCSISRNRREDLIDDLPPTYQECFLRMHRLASYAFPAMFARQIFAESLARCCMMTPFDYVESCQRPSVAATGCNVGANTLNPDQRMELAEEELLRHSPHDIRAAFTSGLPDDLASICLDSDRASWVETLQQTDYQWQRLENDPPIWSSMMEGILSFLRNPMPDIERNYSCYRAFRNGRLMARSVSRMQQRVPSIPMRGGYNRYESLEMAANQRIVFVTREPPEVTVSQSNPGELRRLGSHCLAGLGVLYTYISSPTHYTNEKQVEVFVVDASPDSFEVYRTSHCECHSLKMLGDRVVNIIETDALTHLDGTTLLAPLRPIIENGFACVDGNAVTFVMDYLGQGARVEWTVSGVSMMPPLVVNPEQGLQIVLYRLSGPGFERLPCFFHMSNTLLTYALSELTDRVVADEELLRFVPGRDDGSVPFPDQMRVNRLLDHPVVINLCFCGLAPRDHIQPREDSVDKES